MRFDDAPWPTCAQNESIKGMQGSTESVQIIAEVKFMLRVTYEGWKQTAQLREFVKPRSAYELDHH